MHYVHMIVEGLGWIWIGIAVFTIFLSGKDIP
jgi:hypothetical protein